MINKLIQIISEMRPELNFESGKDFELFGVLDSLDIIFIVDELEKKFGITIEADQINPDNFYSLYAIEAFVKSRIK
jgi:acyl carrier protein